MVCLFVWMDWYKSNFLTPILFQNFNFTEHEKNKYFQEHWKPYNILAHWLLQKHQFFKIVLFSPPKSPLASSCSPAFTFECIAHISIYNQKPIYKIKICRYFRFIVTKYYVRAAFILSDLMQKQYVRCLPCRSSNRNHNICHNRNIWFYAALFHILFFRTVCDIINTVPYRTKQSLPDYSDFLYVWLEEALCFRKVVHVEQQRTRWQWEMFVCEFRNPLILMLAKTSFKNMLLGFYFKSIVLFELSINQRI